MGYFTLESANESVNGNGRRGSSAWSKPLSTLLSIVKHKGVHTTPIGLLFGISYGVYQPIFVELLKDRVCRVLQAYPANFCDTVGQEDLSIFNHSGPANDVQSTTSNYVFYASLIANVPCFIFSLFVGSWSDRFGRKTPLLTLFFGLFLCGITAIILSYIDTHPGYLLFCAAFQSAFGGWVIYYITIYSYVGDHTTEETRALVILLVGGSTTVGDSLGRLIGTSMVSQDFGFAAPFYLFTVIQIVSVIYIVVTVQDLPIFAAETSEKLKLSNLFDIKSVQANWAVLRQERFGNGRRYILMMVIAYATATICLDSEAAILQLFVEFQPLGWTIQKYGAFATTQGLSTAAFLVVTVPIFKEKLKLRDTTLGIVSATSCVGAFISYALSTKSWMLYISLILGLFRPLILVSIRSIILGLIAKGEIGKLMAIVGSTQAVSAIVTALIFMNIFSQTAAWWPGFVFIVMAIFMGVSLTAMAYVHVSARRNNVSTS
ncbi:proton-coupled folate transporter-like isoform X2 [Paramacrobiotus metropolitanus]|nr:proton-coupled folate transporter-like isoform X2 [Paramacrobiotus metropolitanus]